LPDAIQVEKAYLVKNSDASDASARILLHFNPVSLTYSLEASSSQQNQPNPAGATQHVSQYSAKLSFDAIFDNTDTGEDVRITTQKIAAFLKPDLAASGATSDSGNNAPPLLLFHWGAFRFRGVLNQFKETIDFFSKEGVPLRSNLSLGMNEQGPPLEPESAPKSNTQGSLVPTSATDSAASVAQRGGNAAAARALATANGLESLRFTGGATLQVDSSAGTRSSSGFISSAGNANASANWNASGSGALFGAKTSAGVSAGAGAFAGISSSASAVFGASGGLDASAILSSHATADVAAHAGASFSLGGVANMEVGAGLSADVGASANWKDLLRFDEE
jgi:hypothetical protein